MFYNSMGKRTPTFEKEIGNKWYLIKLGIMFILYENNELRKLILSQKPYYV